MTPETQELLDACKKAGYTKVTVLVRDKRVPLSMSFKFGKNFGDWFGGVPRDHLDLPPTPINVICASPEQLRENNWPKIWDIVKEIGLTIGLSMGGQGCGDAHNIYPLLAGLLTPGYYDLTET